MNRKIRRGNQISWREYVLNRSGTGTGGIRNFQNKLSGLAEIGVRGFRSSLMNASRHNAMTLHYEGRFLLVLAASNQGLSHDIFGLGQKTLDCRMISLDIGGARLWFDICFLGFGAEVWITRKLRKMPMRF